jgi:hypothetical protein
MNNKPQEVEDDYSDKYLQPFKDPQEVVEEEYKHQEDQFDYKNEDEDEEYKSQEDHVNFKKDLSYDEMTKIIYDDDNTKDENDYTGLEEFYNMYKIRSPVGLNRYVTCRTFLKNFCKKISDDFNLSNVGLETLQKVRDIVFVSWNLRYLRKHFFIFKQSQQFKDCTFSVTVNAILQYVIRYTISFDHNHMFERLYFILTGQELKHNYFETRTLNRALNKPLDSYLIDINLQDLFAKLLTLDGILCNYVLQYLHISLRYDTEEYPLIREDNRLAELPDPTENKNNLKTFITTVHAILEKVAKDIANNILQKRTKKSNDQLGGKMQQTYKYKTNIKQKKQTNKIVKRKKRTKKYFLL